MSFGRFISFEGGEGAGKSTQARLLAEAMRQRGHSVVLTREPGGTVGAEAIRKLLLSNEGEGWLPRAEALLFAAARSDHVERLIAPALARGDWVISDRFLESSRAYQGGAVLGDAELLTLHDIGSSGLLPDLTLLIEVDPDIVTYRLQQRDGNVSDRIGGRSAAYHAGVNAAFVRMAEECPRRIVRIAGNGSAENTHQRVLAAVEKHVDAV